MNRAAAIAPPSVGNVAVGFDVLGHALVGVGDRVTITRTNTSQVRIMSITGIEMVLPQDANANTAGRALIALLASCPPSTGFDVEIEKGIALGSGMGGSAASSVAAVVAANATLDVPLSIAVLYHAAMQGESAAAGGLHGDNVAPALLGGLVIAPAEGYPVSVPVPAWLHAAIVRPHFPLETRASRAVLSEPYPLRAFVEQSEALALTLAGCFTQSAALIRRGLRDVLVEPRRAHLIPGFAQVKQAALECGALGASISGGGPSVFGWFESRDDAQRGAAAMRDAFRSVALESTAMVSVVGAPGAQVVS
ncbi:MAG: homoserine kinase [Phycisphaerales bacterium]|nr:homoserine kinase [Phycisphaerales bacterium]